MMILYNNIKKIMQIMLEKLLMKFSKKKKKIEKFLTPATCSMNFETCHNNSETCSKIFKKKI